MNILTCTYYSYYLTSPMLGALQSTKLLTHLLFADWEAGITGPISQMRNKAPRVD